MIKSFKHKGLQAFYENGSLSGIQARHRQNLRMQLVALWTLLQLLMILIFLGIACIRLKET